MSKASVIWLFFIFSISICFCLISDNRIVRLSEVHLVVAYVGTSTTFTFVEVWTPSGGTDLSGMTVVFYAANSSTSFNYCSCDGIKTNALGYGSCDCGFNRIVSNDLSGAVVLHNVPSTYFSNIQITAEQGSKLNVSDSLLFQTYGAPVNNSLQQWFAPYQIYHYVPPVRKTAYSVVRCYGDPTYYSTWQASFALSNLATQNGPNVCPPPTLYVNEMHFNKTYIEIASVTPELPLSQATLAVIVDNGTEAVISAAYPLVNSINPNSIFTIGSIIGADDIENLDLPTSRVAVVAIYFNITVTVNSTATSINMLYSMVYSTLINNSIPEQLAIFGTYTNTVDPSGRCSLCACTSPNDLRSASPTPFSRNNCTIACSLDNRQATVRLSEVHSNVAWAGSQVDFTFVEVFTPLGSIDLTGLSVVFYFAWDSNSWYTCPCDGIMTNSNGYGLCNCGPKGIQRVPADVAYQGAIALQLVESSYFDNPVPASIGSQLNVVDAILYQSYGPVDDTNPLKKYFAPDQHYVIPVPITQSAFSIIRCYGNPLTTGQWQASFVSSFSSTAGLPNPCPNPNVDINEIHFNTDFLQMTSKTGELPLDQVTVAYVSSDGIIQNAFNLTNQRFQYTGFFSVGDYQGVDWQQEINLPTDEETGLVVYYNISINSNMQAPTSNVLSSLVYFTSESNVPTSLLPFGNITFVIDTSGRCSTGQCDPDDFQLIATCLNTKLNCTTMLCS